MPPAKTQGLRQSNPYEPTRKPRLGAGASNSRIIPQDNPTPPHHDIWSDIRQFTAISRSAEDSS